MDSTVIYQEPLNGEKTALVVKDTLFTLTEVVTSTSINPNFLIFSLKKILPSLFGLKKEVGGASTEYFLSKRAEADAGNDSQYSLYIGSDGTLVYAVGGNTSKSSVKGYNDNIWHNVALVNSNSDDGVCKYKIFVDGKNIPPIGTSGTYGNNIDVLIGARRTSQDNTGSTLYYNGLIDDVRVYSRALTASEIQTLYAQNKGKYLSEKAN